MQPILGTDVDSADHPDDVIEDRLIAIAVAAAISENSRRSERRWFARSRSLDRFLEVLVDARGSGVIAGQVSRQQDGAVDFFQRRKVGEHAKGRSAGLSEQVGEVGPAGTRNQKKIRIELQHGFGVGRDAPGDTSRSTDRRC